MTVCLVATPDPEGSRPSLVELAMIEAERPMLEAELDVVAAECAFLANPSSWARSRVRRAEQRLTRLCAQLGRPTPEPLVDLDHARLADIWLSAPRPSAGSEVAHGGTSGGVATAGHPTTDRSPTEAGGASR
ncbi:MAG: DUF6284 family protein [Actinomycetota bacterium]